MSVFEQGLEVTAIGMVLVFLSLVLVAVLIWALSKIFPGKRAPEQAAKASVVEPVKVSQGAVPATLVVDQVAAIAVALVKQGLGGGPRLAIAAPAQRAYTAMPWERPAEMWGDDLLQGETVTVVNVDPGSGNWKSQGRLASMQ
jgi:Na+-transporting methylmalonyl-CoA/oxaloacetate decarboxylase gamma subunit